MCCLAIFCTFVWIYVRVYEIYKKDRRIHTEEFPIAVHGYILHLPVHFHHAIRLDVYR